MPKGKTKVLGVSASLRNARFGGTGLDFLSELQQLFTHQELVEYLELQTKILLDEFFGEERSKGRSFTELYDDLRKAKGDRGLSNSEAALAAGLWGAIQENAIIDYCGLSRYFPPSGGVREEDELRSKICSSDAILLSGPVYFGDRGSLAQCFFELLEDDNRCHQHIKNKIFAGIATGAKRNGGQETTLIYQIIDACNLGMLAVGNDSATTAQYGGTAVAGDIGTFAGDSYGVTTAISTGRRIARSAHVSTLGLETQDAEEINIGIWLVQDTVDGRGENYLSDLMREIHSVDEGVNFSYINATKESVFPCIACDICPTDAGAPEQYRCIISQEKDLFVKFHSQLISVDAYLIAAYSPKHWGNTNSVYQKFVERTRYLRRDNYELGDKLVAPLVISEVGANQNLHLRMSTSLIRHLTVLHQPLIGFEYHGNFLNREDMMSRAANFVKLAMQYKVGYLADTMEYSTRYNPIGYKISAAKLAREKR